LQVTGAGSCVEELQEIKTEDKDLGSKENSEEYSFLDKGACTCVLPITVVRNSKAGCSLHHLTVPNLQRKWFVGIGSLP